MADFKIIALDSVDSTNAYVWKLVDKGEKEIIVVTALRQTNGRGRQGQPWLSPKGNIHVSFLFQPHMPLREINFFPLVAGLAVVNVIKKIVLPKLKWPNDVLVNGKKIAGILVEARSTDDIVDTMAVGIGVNVNAKKDEIPAAATSIYLETNKKQDISVICQDLIYEVLAIYKKAKSGKIAEALVDANKYKIKTTRTDRGVIIARE